MPLKDGDLTPGERIFAERYAATGDKAYAALQAGYATPRKGASAALARPAVQSEIVRIQTERLFNEALPLAVDTHIALLRNAATPAGAKVQAIKLIYDRTLGSDEKGSGKEPHEMTGDELANALEKLRREASDRARPVIEHAPQPTPGVFE